MPERIPKYSDDQLKEAIRMVLEDQETIGQSSILNDVPKSTLSFKLRNAEHDKKKLGAPLKMSQEHEQELVDWCLSRAKFGMKYSQILLVR